MTAPATPRRKRRRTGTSAAGCPQTRAPPASARGGSNPCRTRGPTAERRDDAPASRCRSRGRGWSRRAASGPRTPRGGTTNRRAPPTRRRADDRARRAAAGARPRPSTSGLRAPALASNAIPSPQTAQGQTDNRRLRAVTRPARRGRPPIQDSRTCELRGEDEEIAPPVHHGPVPEALVERGEAAEECGVAPGEILQVGGGAEQREAAQHDAAIARPQRAQDLRRGEVIGHEARARDVRQHPAGPQPPERRPEMAAQRLRQLPRANGRHDDPGDQCARLEQARPYSPVDERIRAGIARSFQLVNLFDDLSVLDNVALAIFAREGKTRRIFLPAERDAGVTKEA